MSPAGGYLSIGKKCYDSTRALEARGLSLTLSFPTILSDVRQRAFGAQCLDWAIA